MDVHCAQWTQCTHQTQYTSIGLNQWTFSGINKVFSHACVHHQFGLHFFLCSLLTMIVHCVQWIPIVFIVSIMFIVFNGRPMCTLNAHREYSVHCTQLTAIVHNKHNLCTLCPLGTMNVYCDQWTYIVSNVTLCPLCTINVHCDQWTFIVSIVFIVSIIPIMLIGRNQPKCNLQPIDVVWVCPL